MVRGLDPKALGCKGGKGLTLPVAVLTTIGLEQVEYKGLVPADEGPLPPAALGKAIGSGSDRTGLAGMPHCSFREGSKRDILSEEVRDEDKVEEDVERWNIGGDCDNGGDELSVSSCLHFSEQYNRELFGTAICF